MDAHGNRDMDKALEVAPNNPLSGAAESPQQLPTSDLSTASTPEKSQESSHAPSVPSIDDEKTKDVDKDFEKDGGQGSGAVIAEVPSHDPNVVDFDPDDPEKGVNWPLRKKWVVIVLLSILTLITPLASSMFAPGVPQVLEEFQSDSSTLGSFVVSVYVLGYAAGPIVIAPLSELYGRVWLYNATNVLFVIFTVACALSTNLNMLIGFRVLAGIAGSAPLTMGGGTIADLFVQEERGKVMALWTMGPLLGPVIGPIAGGFLAQAKGWRWVFWVIAIAAGAITIAIFIMNRETYPVVILERKTERLRKETGNPNLRSRLSHGHTPIEAFKLAIIRPLKMLVLCPIVLILSTFNAIVYGCLYLLFTTITEVFEANYGFSSGVVGLTFLGIGVGMMAGLGVFGILSDKMLKKRAAAGEMKPEYRLPLLVPGAVAMPVGLFMYGWTAEKQVFWFVPILGTAFFGLGLIGIFMPIQTYLVDAYTLYAASAIAANTIWRSVFGAVLPLAGQPMYGALGLGWGNSLLGFITLAMIPIPFLLMRYGERIRKDPRFQPKL